MARRVVLAEWDYARRGENVISDLHIECRDAEQECPSPWLPS